VLPAGGEPNGVDEPNMMILQVFVAYDAFVDVSIELHWHSTSLFCRMKIMNDNLNNYRKVVLPIPMYKRATVNTRSKEQSKREVCYPTKNNYAIKIEMR
jgi:hypothetical protein